MDIVEKMRIGWPCCPDFCIIRNAASCCCTEAADEIERLRAQLPAGMQHCTILFKECEKGHGRLIPTNWVDHGCHHCEIERLRDALEYYACMGLGKCTEKRLKDGTCIEAVSGWCGDVAAKALAIEQKP